jgi:hypothetical protein
MNSVRFGLNENFEMEDRISVFTYNVNALDLCPIPGFSQV